jgi:hypothetical protein
MMSVKPYYNILTLSFHIPNITVKRLVLLHIHVVPSLNLCSETGYPD